MATTAGTATSTSTTTDDDDVLTVKEGLDFMLTHFEEPLLLWPRNASTGSTQGRQYTVNDREHALYFFEAGLDSDCRISCYPNYDKLAQNGFISPAYKKPKPTHLFIDIDLESFAGNKNRLDFALNKTIKNIKKSSENSPIPTVLWSGGGYHVHQPLDPESIPVFEELVDFQKFRDPSVRFMRYAERKLSGGLADTNHTPSFKSCLARVPGSYNMKYSYYNRKPEAQVRIIQRWNGVRAKLKKQFVITDFLMHLVQEDVIDGAQRLRRLGRRKNNGNNESHDEIAWIERLLSQAIEDYRKNAVGLILAPYLIHIKNLSPEDGFQVIMEWLERCDSARRLDFNPRQRTRAAIKATINSKIPPMRLDTLRDRNPELYHRILSSSSS
jgi:Primase X